MNRQSYREHLRDVHPKENSKDLRVYGEQSMATFLSSMPRAKRPRQRAPGDISSIGPGSAQEDGVGIDQVLSNREMDENANEDVEQNFEVQTGREEGVEEVLNETEVDENAKDEDAEQNFEVQTSREEGVEEVFHETEVDENANEDEEQSFEFDGDEDVNDNTNLASITDDLDNIAESRTEGNTLHDFNTELMKEIEELSKRVGEIDVTDCKDANEAAVKRVRVVKTYLDVGQDIKSLESSVANLKSSLNYKEEEENVKDIDTDMILKNAKSMTEVTDQVYQFEYEEFKDGGAVICGACEQVFKGSER